MINDIKQRTLPLIIVDFSGISNQDHTKISAICMCMVIPVITIYIFLQKEFIKGITDGAIKS
jgi:raffinose/stachyose/melibiose transport system permease protein